MGVKPSFSLRGADPSGRGLDRAKPEIQPRGALHITVLQLKNNISFPDRNYLLEIREHFLIS
jgi:hypothetical protein